MARNVQPREDLLAEATALVERVELRVDGREETVVVGFRKNGAASLFLGQDPVFQFNTANELRRLFRDSRMLKAEAGRLVLLERRPGEAAVQFSPTELSPEETSAVLAELRQHVQQLRHALEQCQYQLLGQVPSAGDVVARAKNWLSELPAEVKIAQRANVG